MEVATKLRYTAGPAGMSLAGPDRRFAAARIPGKRLGVLRT